MKNESRKFNLVILVDIMSAINQIKHFITPVAISMLVLFSLLSCEIKSQEYGSIAPSHEIWTELLERYVDDNGKVNYQGFKNDSSKFHSYLEILSTHPPDENMWTENELKAFWINAYNAFTIQLIVENYPLSSIKDLNFLISIPFVNTIWDKSFIKIGNEEYSLNDIEHRILRKKFKDPRIHFAINCASESCPVIRRDAFDPSRLDEQLREQSILFINDNRKNLIERNEIQISKIFLWFKGDFTENGSFISFLNLYSDLEINENAEIRYMEYNWSLNE